MAFLEKLRGKPEGTYSPELLELDAKSGPWLAESQQSSLLAKGNYPRFDLEVEEGVIWFGDDERRHLVARIEAIATHAKDDQKFLWSWHVPELSELSAMARRASEDHDHVSEFAASIIDADPLRAWTLAAALAHCLEAEACFRLPGEPVDLFVALFGITELAADDPRSQRADQDPKRAAEALKEYAGPAAVHIGTMLIEGVEKQDLDPVIAGIHRFCEQLVALGTSPVGKDTPAASEAATLATALRQAALQLSMPPGHPEQMAASKAVLALLEETAKRHGAWPVDGS